MTWHIVSDSSCDLFELEGAGESIDFSTVPFAIQIGSKEYLDEGEMDIDGMLRENETSSEVAHTACPSVQTWLERFSKPGPVLAFTISSALSGSYNSAVAREFDSKTAAKVRKSLVWPYFFAKSYILLL